MPAVADSASSPRDRVKSRSRAQCLVCRALEPLERRLLLTRFAIIADMVDNTGLANVAAMVKGWNPAHILTAGDNDNLNHTDYESTVGQHFHEYMSPYLGDWGAGSSTGNRFWAAMGNHDWESSRGSGEYTDYFTLPDNQRYYSIKLDANTEFFVLDSDTREPHGTSATSTQGTWMRERMLTSSAKWKIVIGHHPPYSSAGSSDATWMRWPFKDWGATAVISGHHHLYERLSVNGLPYFINGPAGGNIAGFGTIDANSIVRYNGDFGAMQIDTSDSSIVFRFFRRTGALIDSLTINAPATGTVPVAPSALAASTTSQTDVALAWADNSNNESGFKIERSPTGTGSWAQIDTVGAGVTTYTDTGSTAGTTYYYRIRAYNAAGDSAYSNTAQATTQPSTGTTTAVLVAPGAVWRYLDDGSNQGSAWRATSFGDSTWKSGAAQLGYGDGDEATVVGFGSSSSNKFITTYFRKTFDVADLAAVTHLAMRMIRDDGAVVYLNGTEVWRDNMPGGTVGYTTLASSAISGTGENRWLTQSLDPALLVAGSNVLAVEIHQDRGDSSDVSFNAELTATVSTSQPPPSPPPPPPASATANYVLSAQPWKYLDNGSNQGTAWRATSFDDSTWKSGASQLGYGDGDEATVVSFGLSSSNKFITTYFRKSFDVADPAGISALDFRMVRDDGAVVYLNGVEVFRSNMPSGTIGYTTHASSALGGTAENAWISGTIDPAGLIAGANVLAIEIHQAGPDSSDISFDFELTGSAGEGSTVTVTTPPSPPIFLSSQTIRERDEEEEDALVSFPGPGLQRVIWNRSHRWKTGAT